MVQGFIPLRTCQQIYKASKPLAQCCSTASHFTTCHFWAQKYDLVYWCEVSWDEALKSVLVKLLLMPAKWEWTAESDELSATVIWQNIRADGQARLTAITLQLGEHGPKLALMEAQMLGWDSSISSWLSKCDIWRWITEISEWIQLHKGPTVYIRTCLWQVDAV